MRLTQIENKEIKINNLMDILDAPPVASMRDFMRDNDLYNRRDLPCAFGDKTERKVNTMPTWQEIDSSFKNVEVLSIQRNSNFDRRRQRSETLWRSETHHIKSRPRSRPL